MLFDHNALSTWEHHQVCIERQAQQAIRPGFAAVLINGSDQISKP
jgi:hypothetical protein